MRKCVIHVVIVVISSAFVSGCGHVPMSTMHKLMTYDFATADPAQIRAAARYPAVLQPRAGGAKLFVMQGEIGTPEHRRHEFVLEEVRGDSELKLLSRFQRSGYPVAAYKLSADDLATVRALQADTAKHRIKSGISVSVDACRTGPLPPGALLASTYLRLDPASGYLPVLEDMDLRKEINEASLSRNLPLCASL